jgi:hypothetical protein
MLGFDLSSKLVIIIISSNWEITLASMNIIRMLGLILVFWSLALDEGDFSQPHIYHNSQSLGKHYIYI